MDSARIGERAYSQIVYRMVRKDMGRPRSGQWGSHWRGWCVLLKGALSPHVIYSTEASSHLETSKEHCFLKSSVIKLKISIRLRDMISTMSALTAARADLNSLSFELKSYELQITRCIKAEFWISTCIDHCCIEKNILTIAFGRQTWNDWCSLVVSYVLERRGLHRGCVAYSGRRVSVRVSSLDTENVQTFSGKASSIGGISFQLQCR